MRRKWLQGFAAWWRSLLFADSNQRQLHCPSFWTLLQGVMRQMLLLPQGRGMACWARCERG
jgi:hypothetical protein